MRKKIKTKNTRIKKTNYNNKNKMNYKRKFKMKFKIKKIIKKIKKMLKVNKMGKNNLQMKMNKKVNKQ